MYKCPNCGGTLTFRPEDQHVTCDFCGSVFETSQLSEEKVTEAKEQDAFEAAVYTCPQCGGEVLTTDDTAVTFCSYCGSQVTLTKRLKNIKAPGSIIPFSITREKCEELYRAKVRKALLAPSNIKKDITIEKFRGIYLPYHLYTFNANGNWMEGTGEESHRSGNYIIYNEYQGAARLDGSVTGFSHDASKSFADDIGDAIMPFDNTAAAPFEAAYMSGFYADTADVSSSTYENDAENEAFALIADRVMTGEMESRLDRKTLKLGYPMISSSDISYYPVWFLSVRNGSRISYAAVNGQTGKVYADLPVDFRKFLILALLIAVPFAFLLYLFTITPALLTIFSLILAFILIFPSVITGNRLYVREEGLNDKGSSAQREDGDAKKASKPKIQKKGLSGGIGVIVIIAGGYLLNHFSDWNFPIFLVVAAVVAVLLILLLITNIVKKARQKQAGGATIVKEKANAPFGVKIKNALFSIISIVLCIILLLWAPSEDLIYYAGVIVTLILNGISVSGIIRRHNRMTLRDLPQMETRGGDR